jgi:hypothetical protein
MIVVYPVFAETDLHLQVSAAAKPQTRLSVTLILAQAL